jgi:hypothetical protein
MMNMKSAIGILVAALCAMPTAQAPAAVCKETLLDGSRRLVDDCGDQSCGNYEVDPNFTADLGFGSALLPDTISFGFYTPSGSSTPATGTFNLGSGNNANFATCEQCIVIYQDENASTGVPQKTFFQTGGTITIDPSTVPGAASDVALALSGVTLAEVTIAPGTLVSTPVPNGDCYVVVTDRIFSNSFE